MRGLHDISCIIAVRIGLAMDQRRGEVFALTRGDVDPDEGTIHVGHNVTYKDVARRPRRPLASALSPSTRRPWSTFASGRNARQQSSKRTASSKPTRRQYAAQAREAAATSTTSTIRGDLAQGSLIRRTRIPRASSYPGRTAARQRRGRKDGPETRLGHTSANITPDWYAHVIPQNEHAAAHILGNLLRGTTIGNRQEDPQENARVPQESSLRVLPHENLLKVTAEGSKGRKKNRPAFINW